MDSAPQTEEQASADQDGRSAEPGPKEKMPAWLAILIGTFTALLAIWLLFVLAFPALS